ncbi:MAG: helix-turn-helix domain-containing protein [Roseburia intestinalis]
MDIQGRIRELMEERSWTEYRLAKEANLSHSTVANMFNRNNAPTFPTLEAICNAFLTRRYLNFSAKMEI